MYTIFKSELVYHFSVHNPLAYILRNNKDKISVPFLTYFGTP